MTVVRCCLFLGWFY